MMDWESPVLGSNVDPPRNLAAALNLAFAASSLEDVDTRSENEHVGVDQTFQEGSNGSQKASRLADDASRIPDLTMGTANSGSETPTEQYDSDQECDTSALTFGTIRAPKPWKVSVANRLLTPSTIPAKRPLLSPSSSPSWKKPRTTRKRTSQLASFSKQPSRVSRNRTASRPTIVKPGWKGNQEGKEVVKLLTYIDLTGDLLEVRA